MLAKEEIKRYPHACEEAIKWVNSLGEGVTAEEAWEICPDGSWMAWIAYEVGVPKEERWAWADLARVWTADILDREGAGHGLRECLPITDGDSAYAAVEVARSAYKLSETKNTLFSVSQATLSAIRSINAARTASSPSAAALASDVAYIFNASDATGCTKTADMIRERIKNPF